MPKEHGSWGMFFLPLGLGLIAAGRAPFPTLLFGVSALLLFLAREPFLEAWRQMRRSQPVSAKGRRGIGLLGGSAVVGVFLLRDFPALLAFGTVAAIVLLWQAQAAMKGAARSLKGELTAVAASMLNAPAAYYVATGRLDARAALLFCLALLYFAGTVFYVKMRVKTAHAKLAAAAEPSRRACLAYHLFLMAVLAFLSGFGALPWVGASGYTPAVVRAFYGVTRPTRELNLRKIGWTEVLNSLVWLCGLALAFQNQNPAP